MLVWMLLLTLGVNCAIEAYVFLSSVNERVNADVRCEYTLTAHTHRVKANARVKKIKEQSKTSKKIIQTSKNFFAFAFAFARCERTLQLTINFK